MSEAIHSICELFPEDNPPDVGEYLEYWDKMKMSTETKKYRGFNLEPRFEPETAHFVNTEWIPKAGDIFVCSYPKTGTTLVREILRQIIYCRDEKLLKKTSMCSYMYMYLEYGPVSKYKIVDQLPMSRRIFGTHLPAPLINFKKFQKVGNKMIYVLRNPKDQVLSWYHFTQTYPTVKANIPPHNEIFPKEIKSFINLAITGKQNVLAKDGEGYLEHVRDWAQHKNDSNVMFLMYEDIRQDLENAVGKLCRFVEVDLTDEEIKQVTHYCSLETMRTKEENSKSEQLIVRKGCVGDWKNYLTVYQSEYLDKKVEEILGATDIKFKYTLHSD